MKRGSGKQYTVEGTVNNIAEGTGQDKGEAGKKAEGGFQAQQEMNIIHQKSHGHDAQSTKEQLPLATAAKTESKGHSVVFHEVDKRPVKTQNRDIIAVIHVGFHPDFKTLIQQ